MATIDEQIQAIEEEIFNTQKNKATEHHIGKLKAKIAKLKAQQELQRMKGAGGSKGYYVKKSGDATVALVGYPSVGKSSLLNRLTGSYAEVASYQFTTLEVIPGVMDYKGAKIQILNIKPKYKMGIELKPDNYQIRISKKGYQTQTFWIKMEHENMFIKRELKAIKKRKVY